MELETLAKGKYCGLEGPRNQWTIKTEQAWNDFYTKLESRSCPQSTTPFVDFSKYMVLAVFMGQKATGGYSIEINKVLQKGNTLEVRVQEYSPTAGCVTSMATTQPYHVAKVEKIKGNVKFMYARGRKK